MSMEMRGKRVMIRTTTKGIPFQINVGFFERPTWADEPLAEEVWYDWWD